MHSTLKKLAASVAVAGAITVGTAGAAFAADGASGSDGGAATGQTARHPGIRHQVVKGGFKIVIDQLGVTKEDLKAALQGGQTISEYATSLGKDPQALADALTQAANDRIDQAVADGKLSEERGATMKSEVPERVDQFLNRTWGQHATQSPNAA
jgi:hypothetical protein